MPRLESELDQAHLFLQLVREKRDPRSFIREAISNSHDAHATRVDIAIERRNNGAIDVIIEDDGSGMSPEGFRRFFSLGATEKFGTDLIGEKGLGTKLLFDSASVSVQSRTSAGGKWRAHLAGAVDALSAGRLPEYDLARDPDPLAQAGTRIEARDISIQGPASLLDHEDLATYLTWYSAAGSAAKLFDAERRSFVVTLTTRDGSNAAKNSETTTIDGHRLPAPEITALRDTGFLSFVHSFGPLRLPLVDSRGAPFANLDIVGAVVGPNAHVVQKRARKKEYKGFFLAKDYIPIRAVNAEIARGTGEWQSFHVIANCQQLQLTANREDFRECGNGSVYDACIRALREFFANAVAGKPHSYRGSVVEDPSRAAGAGYRELKRRKLADKAAQASEAISLRLLSSNQVRVADDRLLEPTDDFGTALAYQQLLHREPARSPWHSSIAGSVSHRPLIIAAHPKGEERVELGLVVHTLTERNTPGLDVEGLSFVVCWENRRREPGDFRYFELKRSVR